MQVIPLWLVIRDNDLGNARVFDSKPLVFQYIEHMLEQSVAPADYASTAETTIRNLAATMDSLCVVLTIGTASVVVQRLYLDDGKIMNVLFECRKFVDGIRAELADKIDDVLAPYPVIH